MALAGPQQSFSFSECWCKNKNNKWGKCDGEREAREETQPETCQPIQQWGQMAADESWWVGPWRHFTPAIRNHSSSVPKNHVTLITRTANRLGQTQSVRRHNGVFEINKIDYVTDLQVNDLSNGRHLSKSGRDGSPGLERSAGIRLKVQTVIYQRD